MPHTETTKEWSFCAYTDRTRVLASMLTEQGHDVRLYSGEANEANVTEHVPLMTRAEQREWWPWYDGTQVFNDFDPASQGWQEFNARAAKAITERAKPLDILALTMGLSQLPVAHLLPELRHVEVGIGYSGVFASFRVFESNVWRHYMAGREKTDDHRWFDAVIPRAYEIDDFPLGAGGDSLLYLGRLTSRKGVSVAAELARAVGSKLIVAGQGAAIVAPGLIVTEDGTEIRGDVEYAGVVGPADRARLIGEAKAVIMPTNYLEPGGGVAIEAQLCGTPVLTVPWGAMTETVIEWVSGFHCSTLAEFVEGYRNLDQLNREYIRSVAVYRFGTEEVGKLWSRYLKKIDSLDRAGWYELDTTLTASESRVESSAQEGPHGGSFDAHGIAPADATRHGHQPALGDGQARYDGSA